MIAACWTGPKNTWPPWNANRCILTPCLARITGKPLYGDLVEKIVFNGSQGAKKKDGRAIAYMSSPNQYYATSASRTFANRPDGEVYAPVYPVACCPVQAVRVLPEYVRGLCLTDKSGGLVMLWWPTPPVREVGLTECTKNRWRANEGVEPRRSFPLTSLTVLDLTAGWI